MRSTMGRLRTWDLRIQASANRNLRTAFDQLNIFFVLGWISCFYVAEDYHKNYYEDHQDAAYCNLVIDPHNFGIPDYIKGNEIFLLTGIAAVTIIFGAIGAYFAESGNPDANITSLGNAFWYAIETITTVVYGEYYPVTALGKVISSFLMFEAIGIMWTLVALVGSKIIAKRIKEAPVGLIDETKTVIKNRIDEVEKLSVEELEVLITMIRSLSNSTLGK